MGISGSPSQQVRIHCVNNVELPWISIQVAAYHHLHSSSETSLESQVAGFGDTSCELHIIVDGLRSNAKFEPRSLGELLSDTAALKCADPRDKIYALHGLTVWARHRLGLPEILRPSYTAPIEVCMRDATLAVIQEDESLEFLMHHHLGSHLEPTWVMPWHLFGSGSTKANHRQFLSMDSEAVKDILADDGCSRGSKVDLDVLRNQGYPNSPILRGYRFDRVSESVYGEAVGDTSQAPLAVKLEVFLSGVGHLCSGQSKPRDGEIAFKDPKLMIFLIMAQDLTKEHNQSPRKGRVHVDAMKRISGLHGRQLYPWKTTSQIGWRASSSGYNGVRTTAKVVHLRC